MKNTNKNSDNLAVSLFSIKKDLTITFCGQCPQPNAIHFEHISSPWTEEFLKEIDLSSAQQQKSKIKGLIRIKKEETLYRVKAEIEFEPLLECARSLTLFQETCFAKSECFFIEENSSKGEEEDAPSSGEEICLNEEDLEAYTYEGNFIHLDELILDLLQTSLPTFPLCTPDCKGLCPECGVNLNEVVACTSKKESLVCEYF